MKSKFRFTQIYFAQFFVALLLSTIIVVTLYYQLTPWEMEVVNTDGPHYRLPYEFRDLNHDGFSEQIHISNDPERKAHYLSFLSYQGAIIDQFNCNEKISAGQIFYGDFTGDGYDECFVFTSKQDSVFLYLFDIIKRKTLIKRQFLIRIPNPHPFYRITDAELYDLNNDLKKELLFTLHPGTAPKPRGLYVYDLQKRKIIKRFENNSSKEKLLLYDLTGNGQKEIIVFGKANGNKPENAPFTDYKNWVFILDHNLKWNSAPLPYGSYPSTFSALPVQIHEKRCLLIAHYRAAQKYRQKPLGLYLVDSRGRFARQRYFKAENMQGVDVAVDNTENPAKIFISTRSNQLLCFNTDFNLIKQKTTPYRNLYVKALQDIDRDGKAELITVSTNGMQIFDQDFNLLAKTQTPGHISFRERGKNLPPEIAISGDRFYQYQVKKNPIIAWLPGLFMLVLILISGLLLLSNAVLTRIFTFINYFMYSIKQTSNAVVIIKPNGRLLYFNARTQKLLNSSTALKKNMAFQEAFNDYPDIIGSISESMQTAEPVLKDFTVNKERTNIKGEIRVIPFKTKFNYIYAYLVEIKDFTVPVLSERYKIWINTVHKMAHSIKTPLGSVLLNIERIQQKIQNSASSAIENTFDDFNMTLSEIKRIQDMTKHFLKFTNLEQPNIQPVFLHKILQNTLSHFSAYLGNDLKIELDLEQETQFIPADSKQLEMAFQIFIENAIDALKGKGKILISSILAQNLEENFQDYIEIEIADNGPGIPAMLQDQVFEPFYTTKRDGNGMGLAIAKKIIGDHGGTVELISKENYGAVFRISLPTGQTKGFINL